MVQHKIKVVLRGHADHPDSRYHHKTHLSERPTPHAAHLLEKNTGEYVIEYDDCFSNHRSMFKNVTVTRRDYCKTIR